MAEVLGSLAALKSALMGGDTVQAAVAEKRCIKEPAGCGKSLLDEKGEPRFNFDDRDRRDAYLREWTISGMCPGCWDAMVAQCEADEEDLAAGFEEYPNETQGDVDCE